MKWTDKAQNKFKRISDWKSARRNKFHPVSKKNSSCYGCRVVVVVVAQKLNVFHYSNNFKGMNTELGIYSTMTRRSCKKWHSPIFGVIHHCRHVKQTRVGAARRSSCNFYMFCVSNICKQFYVLYFNEMSNFLFNLSTNWLLFINDTGASQRNRTSRLCLYAVIAELFI